MTIKKSIIALSFSVLVVPFASADSGATWVGGEVGYAFHVMPSTKSRAEVLEEMRAFRLAPVAGDGWRHVGGEAGWAPPTPEYAFNNGRLERIDGAGLDSPRPSLKMTEDERRWHEALYSGS